MITLSDVLLFSPRTYYRLFELYNAAIWPAQITTVSFGLAIWILLRRAAALRWRVIAVILAGCWLWVAIAFHAHRYATINWAAVYFAWGFGLEAALLIGFATIGGRLSFERPGDLASRAGSWIFFFTLAIQPIVGLLSGRRWRQMEVFGVAPDPTAVATLGVLLLASGRGRWALLVMPTIWCAIAGATLLALREPDAWLPPVAAVLVLSLALQQKLARRRVRSSGTSVPAVKARDDSGFPQTEE